MDLKEDEVRQTMEGRQTRQSTVEMKMVGTSIIGGDEGSRGCDKSGGWGQKGMKTFDWRNREDEF